MTDAITEPLQLVDGSSPMTSDAMLDWLTAHGWPCPTIDHAPMYTVEDSKALRVTPEGEGDIKNLFLRNKKGQMWLISCHEDQPIDLKALAGAVGAGRFSFCSEQRLMQYLGVQPGSVSPLALINDRSGVVQFLIDSALFKTPRIYLHPLINTRTTTLSTEDLIHFAVKISHPPRVVTFSPNGVHCAPHPIQSMPYE
ncbi:MAG: prolyl-tRNA synthetase associated domain-containing protein [Gammaproteobacteria bacterium]|jgi:Ala-tRNA(Pro) deacylase|nr:prolyl-tRNA synthetase associated domain-containing protein [Gammaproteobacteria bacterium]NDG44273.1 prolyl-tRNA synthetase associated domain-containing protein [Gammaproteobacteria bacterium]